MKQVFSYVAEYFRSTNKKVLTLCILQTAVLVFLNYHDSLKSRLANNRQLYSSNFTGHYFLFAIAFILPYAYYGLVGKKNLFSNNVFVFLLLLAPAIFSLTMVLYTRLPFCYDTDQNDYWNQVYYWPARLLIMISILLLVWKAFDQHQAFYGLTKGTFEWRPYLLMVVCMVPLIAAASTQRDFLAMYPKIDSVLPAPNAIHLSWTQKLLFELSYGSDFLTIEIFFRGFLVLAFIKWAAADAILPMACFYCAIHFGKPLAECVSSFFGGILLGVIVYQTRSIYGGLVAHLGIAWLMEIGGYMGRAAIR